MCFEACNNDHCFLRWLFQKMFGSYPMHLGVSGMPFTVLPHFYLPRSLPYPWDVPQLHPKIAGNPWFPCASTCFNPSPRPPCFPAIVAPPMAVEGRWAAEVGRGASLGSFRREEILGDDGTVGNDVPQASRPCDSSSQNMEILDVFQGLKKETGLYLFCEITILQLDINMRLLQGPT